MGTKLGTGYHIWYRNLCIPNLQYQTHMIQCLADDTMLADGVLALAFLNAPLIIDGLAEFSQHMYDCIRAVIEE